MENRVSEYIQGFGQELGLETLKDGTGNLLIRKPGVGRGGGVCLQTHLDMVWQSSNEERDSQDYTVLPVAREGWVTAWDTTLGADNGIGVAAVMGVLASDSIRHPDIEALFTVDEERGLVGAQGFASGILNSDYFINLDSETEGELYTGCAGGRTTEALFNIQSEPVDMEGYEAFKLSVSKLRGGHSGIDINSGRASAIKILCRLLLFSMKKFGIRVSWLSGGTQLNAIPREAEALILLRSDLVSEFASAVESLGRDIKREYRDADPGIEIGLSAHAFPENVIRDSDIKGPVKAVYSTYQGVIRMSDAVPGLVETSSNTGSVETGQDVIKVVSMQRSSVESGLNGAVDMIGAGFELGGARVYDRGGFPPWEPDPESPLLKSLSMVYKRIYGRTPETKAVHAGLECGILKSKYPDLDMISFGPTIRYPHSPSEGVEVESVSRFWEFLASSLSELSE